ncbi:hypothetical protein [Kitasatospora sp. NPDC088351]|uniref:hypothetical protein n=1 Tax=Kitasatospora sp. NPDC088351 TaxID=3155180 RepID=UPI0034235244
MLSYEAVTTARLDTLNGAAEEWRALRGRYLGLKDRLTGEVVTALAGGWEGEAATEARALIRRAAEQIEAAAQESADLAGLLADAAGQFGEAQRRLRRLADEDAPAGHLKVAPDGTVTDVHPLLHDESARHQPDFRTAFLPGRRQAVDDLVHRIEAALRQATEADEAAAWALRSDPNGAADDSFNTSGCRSLDEARAARADLGEALALAGKGGALSTAELTRLNALLDRRGSDPAFAEEFAVTLGPQGTLDFWRDVNDPAKAGAYGGGRGEAVRRLQTSLGTTLGTATQSRGRAMRDWEHEIIRLGPRVRNRPGGGPTPYGYQLMSSLLRSGAYDSDFLNAYGESLLAFERGSGIGPQAIWAPDSTQPTWDHLGEGRGGDAVAGFLTALGRNPQASTRFLDPGDPRRGDHLAYLLNGRHWPEELVAGARATGHHSLGLAVEAAATGDRPGREDAVRHHTEAQARVMRDTVGLLDAGIGHERLPDGLRRPLADALADYAADTHDILSGTNRAAKDHAGGNTGGVWTDQETGGTRMATDKGSLIRLLRGVADDPDAHQTVRRAELTHVAQQLSQLPPTTAEKEWKGLMANSSVALGVIDAVQADAILDQRDDDTKVEAWKAKTMYAGVGTPLSLVPVPGMGEAAQRFLSAGLTQWQSSATDEINAAAAGRIERNTLTGGDGGSGHEGISAMVETWQTERRRQSPDALDVDWDEQQMRTVYDTGRSDAATALGRGGENS